MLPVHLYGNPADIPAIAAAAPGIPIVEDAAQAHGARYHGRAVGSDSAAASYSFYPGKTLGAYGDAGAVTTADPELALRLRPLRDHGRFGAKYEHATVGTNARMAELQAAVLRTKLAHLPEWVAARQRLCARYEERLAGAGVRLQRIEDWAEPTWHLFVMLHPDRDRLAAELRERGISTGVHYPIPVHRQPALLGGAAPRSRRRAPRHRRAGGDAASRFRSTRSSATTASTGWRRRCTTCSPARMSERRRPDGRFGSSASAAAAR